MKSAILQKIIHGSRLAVIVIFGCVLCILGISAANHYDDYIAFVHYAKILQESITYIRDFSEMV